MSTETRSLPALLSRVLAWWGRELASLVPAVLNVRSAPFHGFVLAAGPDGFRLFEADGRRLHDLSEGTDGAIRDSVISERLATIASKRTKPAVAVRLPRSAVFSRRVSLPAGAQRDAARILALELEQVTPFRHQDVLLAHRILALESRGTATGTLVVEQLILKRSTLDAALVPLEAHGLTADRVDCWDEGAGGGPAALDVDFLAASRIDAAPAGSRITPVLAAAAVGLLVAAALIAVVRLEATVADLESRGAGLRRQFAKAQAANREVAIATAQQASLADLKAAEVSRARVLEALTRLIPDTDHLTSLKIEGPTVEFAGYAASAAALVPVIERSDLFERVALTAPVTLDERTGTERFGMRCSITSLGQVSLIGPPARGG